jgi:hypothetical protein
MDRDPARDSESPQNGSGCVHATTADAVQLESIRVLVRCGLRLIILTIFSTLGDQGLAPTLKGLLTFAVLYCVCHAAVKREALFGSVLTRWDEAAVYGLLISLVAKLS